VIELGVVNDTIHKSNECVRVADIRAAAFTLCAHIGVAAGDLSRAPRESSSSIERERSSCECNRR